jgi:hypothetical protein
MESFIVFLIVFLVTIIISVIWVNGIDKMKRYHSDYKGEDFLDWNEETKKYYNERRNKG